MLDGSLSDTQTYAEVKHDYGPYAMWLKHSNTTASRLSEGDSLDNNVGQMGGSPGVVRSSNHKMMMGRELHYSPNNSRLNRSNSIRWVAWNWWYKLCASAGRSAERMHQQPRHAQRRRSASYLLFIVVARVSLPSREWNADSFFFSFCFMSWLICSEFFSVVSILHSLLLCVHGELSWVEWVGEYRIIRIIIIPVIHNSICGCTSSIVERLTKNGGNSKSLEYLNWDMNFPSSNG